MINFCEYKKLLDKYLKPAITEGKCKTAIKLRKKNSIKPPAPPAPKG